MYKVETDDTALQRVKEFVELKGILHKLIPASEVYGTLTTLLKTHIKVTYPELVFTEKPWVKKVDTILDALSLMVVEKERQVGFTHYALTKLYNTAVSKPNATVVYVAPNHKTKMYMLERLNRHIELYGEVKAKTIHINKIFLENGSLILLTSPEGSGSVIGARGYRVDLAIYDEIITHHAVARSTELIGSLNPNGQMLIAYSNEMFKGEQREHLNKAIEETGLSLVRMPGLS